jgi:hypothetical protein
MPEHPAAKDWLNETARARALPGFVGPGPRHELIAYLAGTLHPLVSCYLATQRVPWRIVHELV